MHSTIIVDPFPSLVLERKEAIERTIEYLEKNRECMMEILTEVSPYHTAKDEINISIQALTRAIAEVNENRPPTLNSMSVFMPSNVLLYSYVLYLLIPSLYVEKIEFRGSGLVIEQVRQLHNLLKEIHQLPIQLLELSHRKYIKESALQAELVIFTGAYKNAEEIKFQLSEDQFFVFFGHGVNPFILTESADVEKSINDLVSIRTYNSGQDCLGPDVIYVPEHLKDPFVSMLKQRLEVLKFGSNKDGAMDYGPIHYLSAIDVVAVHLNQFSNYIYSGGNIHYRERRIEPTILLSKIEDDLPMAEFFSPIFNVVTYKSVEEILEVFKTGYFLERAMGATVYGDCNKNLIDALHKRHTVSINKTLLDIEDGNAPFGGYGPMANYVSYKGQLIIKPILLSKVLHDYWESKHD
ncbi:aldehyde dehydrogenase family protein [Cytobacillus sp. FSL M8-0252]|uniref:aldehyde dehydrogenase family protein n=1 Tax=Cytobacillus TaxID=2675230 RepID=UPI002481868D|nr:aldehyde dehydrogenase family protein [Cytobacillus kochii]